MTTEQLPDFHYNNIWDENAITPGYALHLHYILCLVNYYLHNHSVYVDGEKAARFDTNLVLIPVPPSLLSGLIPKTKVVEAWERG